MRRLENEDRTSLLHANNTWNYGQTKTSNDSTANFATNTLNTLV